MTSETLSPHLLCPNSTLQPASFQHQATCLTDVESLNLLTGLQMSLMMTASAKKLS